ncbi:MAG: GNAT family N-acetyltransferase [Bacteroidetes bacterium]|nr:GNAT family N-acetyltransferase [Bacteroidota bacterium]
MQTVVLRPARPADILPVQNLIFEHGVNEWNHLPEKEVIAHLLAIMEGKVRGIVAEENGKIVGIMTYETGIFYPDYEPSPDRVHGYIAEGVVHRDLVGHGVGRAMLNEVLAAFAQQGITHIYAKRHEENPFSGRLLEKAGFEIVATFYDPEVRPNGSRRTTVCRYVVGS